MSKDAKRLMPLELVKPDVEADNREAGLTVAFELREKSIICSWRHAPMVVPDQTVRNQLVAVA